MADGSIAEGVRFLEAGNAAKQAALLPNSPSRASALQALSEAYSAERRTDAALACWEEAAKIQVGTGRIFEE